MDAGLLELSFFLSSESDSESDPELEELYESFLTLEDSISADTQAAFSSTAYQPEEEEEEKKHMLYEGAAVTTFQTILLVYQFVLRHSFSTKTFTEFLQLLAVLLPKAADLPKSVYLFKKKLASLFPEAQSRKHYYCTTCQMPVEKDGVCDCGQTNISQFITVPLQPQLKRLMEGKVNTPSNHSSNFIPGNTLGLFTDPSSWNLLQQRFTRLVSDDVQDIYDGKGYKRHQHFLNHPAHVSLSLNTDGVSLFRSSKAEIWPVWIVVNELPKNKRYYYKCKLNNWHPPPTHTHTHTHTLCHKLHDQIR